MSSGPNGAEFDRVDHELAELERLVTLYPERAKALLDKTE
jgi:hypothetical protein